MRDTYWIPMNINFENRKFSEINEEYLKKRYSDLEEVLKLKEKIFLDGTSFLFNGYSCWIIK